MKVQDAGHGLTAEQIREVGAFMQFDRRRYEQQGTGLGLAMAKLLVERNGGTLAIESEAGRGTTVTVLLPLQGSVILKWTRLPASCKRGRMPRPHWAATPRGR